MIERIQWSPDEFQRFLKAAQTFGPPKRGDSLYVWRDAALKAGLKVRPFDPVTAAKMNKAREKVAAAPPPISQQLADFNRKVANFELPVIEMREEPKPEATPAALEAPQTVDHPVLATMAQALTGALLQVLYDPELRKAIRSLITEALAPESALEQQQAITWREPKGPTERKLRAVIAGGGLAMHHQMEPIPGVDLRFWSGQQGESIHRLKAVLQNADVCAVMTKFIAHNAQEIVKSRSNRLKVIYCNGGTNELRPQLAALAHGARP